MNESLRKICLLAKGAASVLADLTTEQKNLVLMDCAKALTDGLERILTANQADLANAFDMKASFIDRLSLTEQRVTAMAESLRLVAGLPDPVGEIVNMKTLSNGLIVGQKRVPMGVVAIIYEARPNVTADAFGLCFKAGSSIILRGGKEAILTNQAIVSVIRDVCQKHGLPPDMVSLLADTSRATALDLMKMNGYIDVLIPRGGAELISSVVQNSTIPVIETGVGNCHIFVDESADIEKAIAIIVNAKTQRPGVCNAMEKLLVHEEIAETFLPIAADALISKNVRLRGDETAVRLIPSCVLATEEDWKTEYADLILAIKIVRGLDDAIAHIEAYSSGHSEAIITENYSNAQRFLHKVDSAAVYVNASTRFTDGAEFGFGAEIGISTQKLHARGPMGLQELTTTKYIIYGNGQIRK